MVHRVGARLHLRLWVKCRGLQVLKKGHFSSRAELLGEAPCMVNHDIVDRAGSGGGRRRLMTAIHGSQCFLRRLLFLLVWLRFYNSFRSFLFLPPSLPLYGALSRRNRRPSSIRNCIWSRQNEFGFLIGFRFT